MLLIVLVRAEDIHCSLFSLQGKSKLIPYSVTVVQPTSHSCSYIHPSIVGWFWSSFAFSSGCRKKGAQGSAHSAAKGRMSFCPCPALTEQTRRKLSEIFPFTCFLTGVYVVWCCRNHIAEAKVENDPRYSYVRNGIFQARRSPKSLCAQKNIS